jgi:DNA-directed RNA polymerase alpha subunit
MELTGLCAVLGIDQVSFRQNTSPLPDEFIAHRLGMIPLISTGIKTNMRETRVSLAATTSSDNPVLK